MRRSGGASSRVGAANGEAESMRSADAIQANVWSSSSGAPAASRRGGLAREARMRVGEGRVERPIQARIDSAAPGDDSLRPREVFSAPFEWPVCRRARGDVAHVAGLVGDLELLGAWRGGARMLD